MRVGQSKRQSWLEAIANQLIGFAVAILSQYPIFAAFGIEVTFMEHIQIGLFFTVVSVLRSYLLRRLFNWVHLRSAPA